MPVEALELAKEARVQEIPIEDADRIEGITGRDQIVPGLLDGPQVTGGHEASHAGQGESFAHGRLRPVNPRIDRGYGV